MTKKTCIRWAFDLSTWHPTLPQLAQAMAAVQLEERTRLMRFHFINDLLSSLVGRLMMRKFVSTYSGLAYKAVRFDRDARGKPYWVNVNEYNTSPIRLSFNVSHQGDFVVLAGIVAGMENDNSDTVDFGVGVDVMKIEYTGGKPLTEFFRLMRNKFSENEWKYILRPEHNEKQQLKAFMRHWCLKESYVKELGVGITIDLKKISFSVDLNTDLTKESTPLTSTTLHCNGVAMQNWHFEEHILNEEICVAIAFKNIVPSIMKFQQLTIDFLLVNYSSNEQIDLTQLCKDILNKDRRS